MKVQDKKFLDEIQYLKFAQNERDIMEKVSDSPFIVQIKHSFQNEKKLFIVMEYCPCGTLSRVRKKFRNRKMPEEIVKAYIAEIIVAIKCLHDHNILYRDLKPLNVLIGSDGHIKLADFGLSKFIEGEHYYSNEFCGTHAYLAPEMVQGMPHGKSIDWYGVGIMIYELIFGLPPYYSNDADELYQRIVGGRMTIPDG